MGAALVWFRLDLRLADNPALTAAMGSGQSVIPVFIWAPEEEDPWAPGAASKWWLHQSLRALDESLGAIGSKLVLRRGPTEQTIEKLIYDTGASSVYWNRRYEPAVIARDADIKRKLRERGVTVETFNSNLLFEPWTIRNKSGKPFQVFTHFWKECLSQTEPTNPVAAPKELQSPHEWPESLPLRELELEPLNPKIDWAAGLREAWRPGEAAAKEELDRFQRAGLDGYSEERNLPAHRGTSRLSPHLHFGEIGPRTIWHPLRGHSNADAYLREIGWREFANHLLYHFPETTNECLRSEFAHFPWRRSSTDLKKWQRGQTGYPIVDAGMHELWKTGWMHNRVRMVVASFLTKHLRIHWEEGAYWFWDTLVDADLANNTLGWQWSSGCGADAAPYFRIFNPALQSERYDPDGEYVRRWAPESGSADYPAPMVDHKTARQEALAAFQKIRRHG